MKLTDLRGKTRAAFALCLFVCLFAVVVVRTAWVCDDAYITCRTVDNFINGYGLTWNPLERVQAYTNPLWMFFVSAVYIFTHEAYYTSIFLSLAVSLLALVLFVRLAGDPRLALLGLLVLTLSKAFVEYSTSGMENPLIHLLAAVFLLLHFRGEQGASVKSGRLLLTSLVAALAGLNRLDTLLLFLPALAWSFWRARSARRVPALVGGLVPILSWELFSLLYYGFPFPNTAYAKLNVGIPRGELVQQGLLYLQNSLSVDPLTALVIVLGAVSALLSGKRANTAIVGGIGLYLAYVVCIGGDFMSGRFLSAPLFLSVVLLSRSRLQLRGPRWPLAICAVVVIGLLSPCPVVLSGPEFRGERCDEWEDKCIADARGFFYLGTGLLTAKPGVDMPAYEWAAEGRELRRQAEARGGLAVERGGIGFFGYYAGPKAHIVDKLALADPLLARLPPRRNPDWCIGHFERVIPDGYLRTLSAGRNVLEDRNLRQYYDKLLIVTRGSLTDLRRLKEIVLLNLGKYDDLIDRDWYSCPPSLCLSLAELREPKREGTPWEARDNVVVRFSAIDIALGSEMHSEAIETSLRGGFTYELIYYLDGRAVARQRIQTPGRLREALAVVRVNVPTHASSAGFDSIRVVPVKGDKRFSLGHLVLLG